MYNILEKTQGMTKNIIGKVICLGKDHLFGVSQICLITRMSRVSKNRGCWDSPPEIDSADLRMKLWLLNFNKEHR